MRRATAIACAGVYAATGNAALTAGLAAGGFLIDVDHVVDYVLFERQRDLRPASFLRYYLDGNTKRVVLMLHSYELLVLSALLAWFLVYGFYFGFAEGTEKALVADLAPASRRGFAFGIYNAVQGVGALAASVLFGVIWKVYGAPVAFGVGAALALVATALLFVVVPRATES